MMLRSSLFSMAFAAVLVFPSIGQAADAQAEMLNNKGEGIGFITVQKGPEGLLLNVDLKDLPPGPHGFHVHAVGDCSDHDHFKNAAGHVKDDDDDRHGLLNPEGPEAGDLPNLIVHADGTVKAEIYAPDLEISHDRDDQDDQENILDADGSAFMIHAQADDHKTQPIGGAGDRIACGVIKAVQ